jgi:very-short-patch-repair endonuclease
MKRLIEYDKNLKSFSRVLRKKMTDAERLIRRKIRGRQIKGFQFYRQKPIGNYIVDFYCPKIKLVLEVDGGQHYQDRNIFRDKARSDYLNKIGFKVLRFTNIEVLKNIDGVINKIWEETD